MERAWDNYVFVIIHLYDVRTTMESGKIHWTKDSEFRSMVVGKKTSKYKIWDDKVY